MVLYTRGRGKTPQSVLRCVPSAAQGKASRGNAHGSPPLEGPLCPLCWFMARDDIERSDNTWTHVVPFLWRSLPKALHCDNHASGNTVSIALITLSEPPH